MNHEPSFPRLEVPARGDLQSSPPSASPAESTLALERAPLRWPVLASVARSVWAVPTLKLLGFCCVLTCIAWLGERSRDTTIYGPELPNDVAPEPAGRAASPKPEPEQLPAAPASPATSSPSAVAPPPCASVSAPAQPVPPASALLPDGRLVLNEASAEELDRLPGIGKKRAEEIVALRVRLGRFKRTADLLRVRGIGPRSLASLKELLVLDRPQAPVEKAAPAEGGPARKPQ